MLILDKKLHQLQFVREGRCAGGLAVCVVAGRLDLSSVRRETLRMRYLFIASRWRGDLFNHFQRRAEAAQYRDHHGR